MEVDQTDIGDEYFRRKTKTNLSDPNRDISRILPFNLTEHVGYYNHSLDPQYYKFGIEYLYIKAYSKVRIEAAPSYSKIASPLRGEYPLSIKHFRSRLISYINYVSRASNNIQLIILTHDHKQHLSGEQTVSAGEIVSDVVSSQKILQGRLRTFISTHLLKDFELKKIVQNITSKMILLAILNKLPMK